MDEKIKDQDVLLVNEKGSPNLKVVSGVDKDGNLKTVPPTKANEQDFMKIDKHSNVLENFFTNFMRQAKDPTHFGFFKVPVENLDAESYVLSDMLKDPDNPSNRADLEAVSVDPRDYVAQSQEQNQEQSTSAEPTQSESYKPIDAERIDWQQFENLGVTKEQLEKSGALEAMINYRKSPELIPINAQLGDMKISVFARLSLRETEDGRIVPVPHTHRPEPELDKSFYGVTFSAEDKANLLNTGNLGRVVNITNRATGETSPVFISIDQKTNEIVAYSADRARIPNEVKGVVLDETQKSHLKQGGAIYVEGMTAKSGKTFNATLQYNADKRGLEFQFPKNQEQNLRQSNSQEPEKRELRIPAQLKGREVSPEEQAQLKEGKVVYMTGLKDGQGKEFNAYVRPNFENGKFDFLKWNPEKSTAKDVAPATPDSLPNTPIIPGAGRHSEGKPNEAIKDLKEPLKQGQTQPTEQQKQETEQSQVPQKPRGMRM